MAERWKCTLCKEAFKSPVVTNCGHTFCWRCLCKHMETSNRCPKCNALLDESNFLAIYGHGTEDPHIDELPPLPGTTNSQPKQPEPEKQEQYRPPPPPQPEEQFEEMGFPRRRGVFYANIGGMRFYRNFGGPDNNVNVNNRNNNNENGDRRYNFPRLIVTFLLFVFYIIFQSL